MADGYWRCPVCGGANSNHAYWCKVTDDTDLEWREGEEPPNVDDD